MATERLLPADLRTDGDASEPQLRRQRDFYRRLFQEVVEAFPHPVGVVDGEGVVAHWNEQLGELVGVPASEAVGRQAYDVVGTEGEDEVLSETVARRGEPVVEDRIRTGESADGDLWAVKGAAFPLTGPDEDTVGALQINTVVTDVVKKNRRLGDLQSRITDEVATATERLRVSLTETADHGEAIREATAEQADRIDDIHGQLSQVRAESDDIAERVGSIDDSADAIGEEAERGKRAATDVVETVESAADAAETVRENADRLTDRAADITQVTDAIADVADQTNLLALNANIEAARASDGGDDHGFAVVADEVKSLAEQSKAEADTVAEQVEAVRATIAETAESVQLVHERLDTALAEARELDETQASIAGHVREVTAETTDVASAVESHATRLGALESEVTAFAEEVETISERTDDIADATSDQTETVRELDETVQRVADELDAQDLEIGV